MKSFYTTKEFAEVLGLTDAYVRQMILGGKVDSQKVGRDHLIPATEIEKARQRRTQRGPEPMKKKDAAAVANGSISAKASAKSAAKKTAKKGKK